MTRPKWLAILVFLLLGTGAFAQAPGIGNDAKSKAGAATPTDSSPGARKTAHSAKNGREQKYVRPTDPSLYVGTDTCKTCHEDMHTKGFYKSYEDSPHFVTTLDSNHEDPTSGAVQDIYAPRNFRANLVTLSLRYAF